MISFVAQRWPIVAIRNVLDTESPPRKRYAYNRLAPLLEFGGERDALDLPKVVLTHHNLRKTAKRTLDLTNGEATKLQAMSEVGTGSVQDKEKALLEEIIQKVNRKADQPERRFFCV